MTQGVRPGAELGTGGRAGPAAPIKRGPETELELCYQVPPALRVRVDTWLRSLPGGDAPRQRLRAAYVDTPDRALARAGLALRLRCEGRRWVQTLKGMAADGLTRLEHNLPLPVVAVDPGQPRPDPARHAGHPLGDRLLARLAEAAGPLENGFSTDILRRRALLRSRHGSVELAFDVGVIEAGGQRLSVCELEIERSSGRPRVVSDVARRWALPLGLWLDARSKAQRGDLLARRQPFAPAAWPPAPGPGLTPAEGIAACRPALLANASQVASGLFEPAHRSALRRTLLQLGPWLGAGAETAQHSPGAPLAEAAIALAAALEAADADDPAANQALLRAVPAQGLLLAVLALGLEG